MRVLFVAHNFPRHRDDVAGSFLLSLARGLIRRGHSIGVVAPHHAGVPLRESIDGIEVYRYRYGSDADETLAYAGTMADQVLRSWKARFRLLRFLLAARGGVSRAVRDFRPDVIHVHWWFPNALALLPSLVRGRRIPWVLTSHGTDLFLLDRLRVVRVAGGALFRRAQRVTVISTPLVNRAERLGVERDRIAVIPMPVDPRVVEGPRAEVAGVGVSATPRLLFVGRLVERKGAEFAVRALALVRARGVAATLRIAGDGPLRAALEQLALTLGVADAVSFLGELTPEGVASEMRSAEIFLMPAVTDWKGEQEGFGMVIVEAMLAGLPVVASRSGGIPDIVVHGESGVLVEERDAAGLAAAVLRLSSDAEFARALASGGTRRVLEHFHPEAIAERFEAVYLSASRAAGQ